MAVGEWWRELLKHSDVLNALRMCACTAEESSTLREDVLKSLNGSWAEGVAAVDSWVSLHYLSLFHAIACDAGSWCALGWGSLLKCLGD